MKKVIILHIVILFATVMVGQDREKELLNMGNKEFNANNFDKAAKFYEDALDKNNNYAYAMYNLGAAYFSQNEFEKASDQFASAALTAEEKDEKSAAYYNLGCSDFLSYQELIEKAKANPEAAKESGDPTSVLKESIEAFKNALRNDPSDEDARYNLAYTQKVLDNIPPQNEQNGEDQDKDQENEDKEDKKEDQEGDQDKENEEKGDQGEQDEKNDGEQEQKDQEQKPTEQQKMSKEDAQRILEAIDRQEKEIREKMNLKKARTNKVIIEKDW